MQMIKDAKKYGQEDLDKLFSRTCIRFDFEGIKYLLTSPELILRPDIHYNNDEPFKWIIEDQEEDDLEVVKYLIFEHNLEKTECIEAMLNTTPTEFKKKIDEMFAIRDLKQSLDVELNSNTSNLKKAKI